jgi:RNA polymerase primary sigma factor
VSRTSEQEQRAIALHHFDATLAAYPVLTPAQERALFDEFRLTQHPTVRERLIKSNLRLVLRIAKERWVPGFSFELHDVIGYGCDGLVHAVDKHDPALGRFSTFATLLINQAISRGYGDEEALIHPPQKDGASLRQDMSVLKARRNDLYRVLGREPTEMELAGALGWSKARVRDLLQWGDSRFWDSLSEFVELEDGSQQPAVAIGNAPPAGLLLRRAQHAQARVRSIDKRLPNLRGRKVIEYLAGLTDGCAHTVADAAERFNVSETYVHGLIRHVAEGATTGQPDRRHKEDVYPGVRLPHIVDNVGRADDWLELEDFEHLGLGDRGWLYCSQLEQLMQERVVPHKRRARGKTIFEVGEIEVQFDPESLFTISRGSPTRVTRVPSPRTDPVAVLPFLQKRLEAMRAPAKVVAGGPPFAHPSSQNERK